MLRLSLNSNQLKLIAVSAMVFDHFAVGFFSFENPYFILLRVPGRIAAPIMCYMISEGYFHTGNIRKYLSRLFIFSLISHVPYNVYFGFSFFQATSIMWSLFLGLLVLTLIKKEKINILIRIAILFAGCLLSVRANWNYLAVLWIVFFGVFKGDFKKQMLSLFAVGLLEIIPVYLGVGPVVESAPHFYRFGVYLAIPLLCAYNGEKGRSSRIMSKFFYWFYPLHLIALYYLRCVLP